MGLSWTVQVVLNVVTSILMGGRQRSDTHRGAGDVQPGQTDLKMPAFKIKVIVMRPQAKEHWPSPELGRWGADSPQSLWGHSAADTLPSITLS